MAYKSNGTIAIGSQRAILDASNATVELTLVAPGVNLIGKLICAIAFNIDNTTSITYDDVNGSTTHTFTQVGETVWFYGATETQWFAITDQKITLGTYGDGRDGDVTISSNTSLTENKFYENLTVNSSIEVQAENLVICVKDTLTMNADSYFRAHPDDGATGDTGGAGGSALAERWYGASGAGGTGGQSGGNGTNGGSVTSSLGGAGGDGGRGGVGIEGDGGTATPPSYLPYFLEAVLNGKDRDGTLYTGGAGGGGGGTGAGVDGGGGGGGGGILCVVAKRVVLDTTGSGDRFNARGGNGGNAGTATNSGGGGGGGGGFVCLIYQTALDENGNELSNTELEALINVNGGAAGTPNGTGLSAFAGSSGNTLILRHG